jgi:hypothetical protein
VGQVISSAAMSLDGYIAKDDNTIGRLFDWLQNGSVEVPSASGDIVFHMSPPRTATAIELVQWPDGHPDGMTRSDLADPGRSR